MYCRKCGKEVSGNMKYCGYCGANLEQDNTNSAQKNAMQEAMAVGTEKGRKHFSMTFIIPVIIVVCIVIGWFFSSQKKHESQGPVVYLTANHDLEYSKTASSTAINISSFGSSEISYYYNDDEPCVFFSDEGDILYYFDLSKGYYDDGGAPLYCANVDSLNSGQCEPVLIDEYAIMNRTETSYAMEVLSDGRLIYMGYDYSQQCYELRYFDGSKSSSLVKGDEIYVSFNSEKTLANICVDHDTGTVEDTSWYRLTVGDYLSLEYVCDGTIYPLQDINCESDFQTMVENDIIINFVEYHDEYGYYSVDLYVHGQWRENLIEKLPWFSRGPFGIEVGNGVSFYLISTADLMTTTGQYYEGDSEQWTFYQYKRGFLYEVNENLRVQNNLPDNAILCNSIYCVNDEVLFRYNQNYTGVNHDIWMSFNANGEIMEVKDDMQYFYDAFAFGNTNGDQVLMYYGYNGETHPLYVYSKGEAKQVLEELEGINVYKKSDEIILVAYDSRTIYLLKASDVSAEITKNSFSTVDMQDDLWVVMPYSEKGLLCILSNRKLSYWDGKKSNILCDDVLFVWSEYQNVVSNKPRIY